MNPVSGAEESSDEIRQPGEVEPQSGIDSSKLVKPQDAVKKIEKYLRSSLDSKAYLVDKLRDGKIKAYALWYWPVRDINLKNVWSHKKPANAKHKVKINRNIFLGSKTWREDLVNWKWNAGDFYCIGKLQKRIHIYKNVRFDADDLNFLLVSLSEGDVQLSSGKGGRPRRDIARDDVWAAVLEIYKTDGPGAFRSHKTAAQAIAIKLKSVSRDEKLGDASITPIITKARRIISLARHRK